MTDTDQPDIFRYVPRSDAKGWFVLDLATGTIERHCANEHAAIAACVTLLRTETAAELDAASATPTPPPVEAP